MKNNNTKASNGLEKTSLGYYYDELSKYPLLSEEETSKLLLKAKNNDLRAKSRLVNCNLRLVWSIANSFSGVDGASLEDLITYGNIGLNKAVDSFDPNYNVKFSTYAYYLIRGNIIRNINKDNYIIKLPQSFLNNLKIVKDIQDKIGLNSTIDEIYEYSKKKGLGLSKESIIASIIYPKYEVDSTNQNNSTSYDLEDDPSTFFNKELLTTELNKVIDKYLNEKEKYIIIHYYGLNDNINATYQDIGSELGISKERVRQLRNLALEKIRKADPTLKKFL